MKASLDFYKYCFLSFPSVRHFIISWGLQQLSMHINLKSFFWQLLFKYVVSCVKMKIEFDFYKNCFCCFLVSAIFYIYIFFLRGEGGFNNYPCINLKSFANSVQVLRYCFMRPNKGQVWFLQTLDFGKWQPFFCYKNETFTVIYVSHFNAGKSSFLSIW